MNKRIANVPAHLLEHCGLRVFAMNPLRRDMNFLPVAIPRLGSFYRPSENNSAFPLID